MWEKHKSKLIIAIVCLVAAGGLYLIRGGGEKKLRPDKLPFVCVETGKIYWIKRGRTLILPLENPDTGRRTLMPVVQKDGQWYVVRRHAGALTDLTEQGLNKVVDPDTLLVRK